MNNHRHRETSTHNHNQSTCYHPHHASTAGVCPFCLTERLELIAVKQHREESTSTRLGGGLKKQNRKLPWQDSQPPNNKSKIFALGSLLNRFELRRLSQKRRHRKRPDSDSDYGFRSACDDDLDDQYYTSSSLEEDSFISIKFGDDGAPSWDKNKAEVLRMSKKGGSDQLAHVQISSSKTESGYRKGLSVVEHTKLPPRQPGWQKWIEVMLRLIRLRKRSLNKATVPCNVGDGNKKKKNWLRRVLSRRRRNK